MSAYDNTDSGRLYLAIDIGGSSIKYGVLDESFNFVHKNKIPSRILLGGEELLNRVMGIIADMSKQYPLEGVAIATTGAVDSGNGRVLYADDVMVGYTGTDFREIIKQKFNLNATACNDVNCLALSQIQFNKGKDFIVVAIGTGIGGGIVISDKLYEGYGYSAGEFGLMHLRDGKNWESLCSISALVKSAKEQKLLVSNGRELFDLFDAGNDTAYRIIDVFYKDMASALANLIYAFSPQKIIIGGGISARGDSLVAGFKKYLSMMTDQFYYEKTTIECAVYENDASMIGALQHYLIINNE
ncbi:MAG TPA: ROK family protein [Clostridia bacterium]|jgi:predicted NBD/HSP70 family sugar kinase|nr:ROK family protein [Clostridiaceae bacterium]HOF27600.1 ROK family protein [Clostridia bacterium]HOR90450.1 ROK family protein [Clostridia bacterium]HPL08898.1 ROK family protein [Clostridia bacterium]